MRRNQSAKNSVIRQVMLLVAIGGPLMLSVGCVTTQSQVRSKPSCTGCACEECSMALSAAEGKSGLTGGSASNTEPGEVEYELSADAPGQVATPLPVPPLPVPPETPVESTMPRQAMTPPTPVRDMAAREECAQLQAQTNALQEQLQSLQAHLNREEMKQQALKHSLTAVNARVNALSGEVTYWKQEVQRIDQEAEAQHREDLQSLSTISELISRLPRPESAEGSVRR